MWFLLSKKRKKLFNFLLTLFSLAVTTPAATTKETTPAPTTPGTFFSALKIIWFQIWFTPPLSLRFFSFCRSLSDWRLQCSIQYWLQSGEQHCRMYLSSTLPRHSKTYLCIGWCTGPQRVSHEATGLPGWFEYYCWETRSMWYVNRFPLYSPFAYHP